MQQSKYPLRAPFLTALILALFLSSCSLRPLAWQAPTSPERRGVLAENDALRTTQHLDLQGWYGPEDIAVDADGNAYCGVHAGKKNFEKGAIVKVSPKGEVSLFCETGGWVAGLHFDADGNLIACDQKRGLVKIDPEGKITVLAREDEFGRPFLIPNDVDIASDGLIYFSNTSSKYRFSQRNARRIIMEMRPDGGLFKYDPARQEVTTLIDSSYFGNGVAVSQGDEFVLMVDLAKYRILRHWLKGPRTGETDTFIENLPGLPNGIARRPDGTFWLGFTTRRSSTLDRIQNRKGLKKFLFGILLWLQPKQEAYGMIALLSAEGEILKMYCDPSGKRVSEASSIEEFEGKLYIGGDLTDHIGVFELE